MRIATFQYFLKINIKINSNFLNYTSSDGCPYLFKFKYKNTDSVICVSFQNILRAIANFIENGISNY